jgi:hypothetical protein
MHGPHPSNQKFIKTVLPFKLSFEICIFSFETEKAGNGLPIAALAGASSKESKSILLKSEAFCPEHDNVANNKRINIDRINECQVN